MTAVDLLHQFHERGVEIKPYPDGKLRCRAPKDMLTPALLDAMRQHKDGLHGLVEAFEERAAIAEYGGGLSRPEAEAFAWESLVQKEMVWQS